MYRDPGMNGGAEDPIRVEVARKNEEKGSTSVLPSNMNPLGEAKRKCRRSIRDRMVEPLLFYRERA